MKTKIRAAIAAASLCWASMANADIGCTFPISGLFLSADGWVSAIFQGSGYTKQWQFCSTAGSTTVNTGYVASLTVTSDTCKAFFSQLLTAKSLNKSMALYFHGPADCASASLPVDGQISLYPYNEGFY